MLQPKGLLLVQSLIFIDRDTRAKPPWRRSQGRVNGLRKRRPQNGPTLNCRPLPISASCCLSYSGTVPMISAYHVALNSMRMLPNAGTQNHLTDLSRRRKPLQTRQLGPGSRGIQHGDDWCLQNWGQMNGGAAFLDSYYFGSRLSPSGRLGRSGSM